MEFNITSLHTSLEKELQFKINMKTKPLGSLGKLETIALQIGLIQNTKNPSLNKPTIAIFAGDHGISKKGEVNPYPQVVTQQMVSNFLKGGAAINTFCKQNNIDLKIVDAGVNHDFQHIEGLIDAKIDFGTKNYQEESAMSMDQCHSAMNKGTEIVDQIHNTGCNILGFGEMGIGNSSSAALLMAYCTDIPIEECVGAGAGVQMQAMIIKKRVLKAVFEKHQPSSSIEALAAFGGFEIAMITGAILRAAELHTIIIIDGFIVTAALLIAREINENVLDYCIFAHTSEEQGHQKMLDFLGKKSLISLGMRLGEGTGAAIAYPIIESAVAFLNNMASFEDAGVSENE